MNTRTISYWAAFLLLAFGRLAMAEIGKVTQLPSTAAGSPFLLNVDSRWVSGVGYLPIRLQLETANGQPTVADRQFRFEVQLSYEQNESRSSHAEETVTHYLKLGEGEAETSTTIRVLQRSNWEFLRFTTYVDGKLDRALSTEITNVSQIGFKEADESCVRVLFVTPGVPSIRGNNRADSSRVVPDCRILASLFPNNMFYGIAAFNTVAEHAASDEAATAIKRWNTALAVHPSDLLDRVLDYSCFELIVIERRDLETLQETMRDRWAAIRGRVACGATLLVYNVDPEQPKLDVQSPYPSDSAIGEMAGQIMGSSHRGNVRWEKFQGFDTSPSFFNYAQYPTFRRAASYARGQLGYSPGDIKNAIWHERGHAMISVPQVGRFHYPSEQITRKSNGIEQFPHLPYVLGESGFGRVVLFSGNPFPGRVYEWSTLFTQLKPSHHCWRMQHGITMNQVNSEYWTLFIPGVGMAPVTSFLVLITLFAIVIGPVNYFLLKRIHQLHLILVTVPLGALLVTASLVAYATVGDGIGVRSRVRSLTMIDQDLGLVSCWSRQNYYAGVAASTDLSFPADAVVFPVHYVPDRLTSQPYTDYRQVSWEDAQYFGQGFLEKRAQSQFLAYRATESPLGLAIKPTSSGLEVTNNLGTRLQLAFINHKDLVYRAEGIADGGSGTAVAVTSEDRSKELRDLATENTPEVPPGFQQQYWRRSEPTRYGDRMVDGLLPGTSFQSNLMEQKISKHVFESGTRPVSGQYIAITDRCATIPLASPNASQERPFHVVVGYLRSGPQGNN